LGPRNSAIYEMPPSHACPSWLIVVHRTELRAFVFRRVARHFFSVRSWFRFRRLALESLVVFYLASFFLFFSPSCREFKHLPRGSTERSFPIYRPEFSPVREGRRPGPKLRFPVGHLAVIWADFINFYLSPQNAFDVVGIPFSSGNRAPFFLGSLGVGGS